MDPLAADRWTRIEALFSALVDAAADERTRALAEAAAIDPELAHTVRGMLAHAGDGDRLRHVVDAAADAFTTPGGAALPPRFGAFRVTREIGRGGMGVVYEGVSDDEFHRRVAIKVAPLARVGAAADARFRLERQILSSLEHPHIARFLDAGTEGHVPFMVMEFVEGEPITTYVATRTLPVTDRLTLVQKLCAALQYAHQRLVVHRDLKPTNILVTADGTPKLLDFGVAKLLDTADAPAQTLGALAWTPDYASPEQVTGELVGTPSDVYSLGLVLYEVLTGQRAQVADTTSPLALSRSVCEADPVLPSARVAATNPGLARTLRGDLDTIVMTALQKDASRRYASAAALSDDITRYLQGLPVEARAGSAWYRLRKTIARHRGAAVAATLVALAIVVGVASTAYQARRADRRFQQVRALANEFVFGVHDRIETLPGSTEARRALVQTALTYLENLREDAGSDAALARELATAYSKVGRVQGHPLAANLGDPAAALTSFGRARELLTPLDADGDVDASLLLARVERDVAAVQRAKGDGAAAAQGLQRARLIAERLEQARPNDDATVDLLGELYAEIARLANDDRDPATATEAAQKAIRIAEAQVTKQPADRSRRNNLATAYHGFGAAQIGQGTLTESVASFRRAVEIREALVQEAPGDNEMRRALVVSLGNMGDVLGVRSGENLGDYAGAAAAFERAVALSREIAAGDPNDRRAAFDLVNGLLRLGGALAEIPDRTAEAAAAFAEADRVNGRLLAGEPGSIRYLGLQVVLDRRFGRLLRLDGQTAEAERHLVRARRDAESMFASANGAGSRLQHALVGVELARLYADTQDRRGAATAAAARTEMSATAMPPILEAQARADLGHALLVLARGGAPAAPALAELTASASLWQAQALTPGLAAQRDRVLGQVRVEIAAAEILGRR